MSSPLYILHESGSPISELVHVQPEAFWKLVSTVSNFHRGAQLPHCLPPVQRNPTNTPNRKPPDRGGALEEPAPGFSVTPPTSHAPSHPCSARTKPAPPSFSFLSSKVEGEIPGSQRRAPGSAAAESFGDLRHEFCCFCPKFLRQAVRVPSNLPVSVF